MMRAILLAVFVFFADAAQADEGDSILVLDASGSMWGQIDGEPKIAIAKDVLGGLLADLPAERRLGLIAYGHRRKGDCGDIEELASVGTDRSAIRAAIDGLSPKGKTPMASSIKLAADKLKFTERKATIVLVSDGIETCEPDPCGVAAALEQAGVDLTVHVVGFDVAEENAEAQLRCIAENTGGEYVSATNAEELADALETTVAAAPEAVSETKVRLRATELAGGLVIEEGLVWTVTPQGGGEPVVREENAGVLDVEIAPGVYDIAVERASDGLSGAEKGMKVHENSWKTVTIALDIPVEATVAPEVDSAVAGTSIRIGWTGPDRKGDYITIVENDADNGAYRAYAYTRQGNPAELRMPIEPGDYEVRYMLGQPIRVLASADITATPAAATLTAPDQAIAGEEITVEFTGPPAGSGDWITIVAPDADEKAYTDYYYSKQGSPGTLRMPLEAGDYEIRFVQGHQKVLARRLITVKAALASLSGPETAVAGEEIKIDFTGPEPASGDWITVTAPDAPPNKYGDYHYTRQGSPATVRMPLEPGEYELRFVQGNKKVIARQLITITEAVATLAAKKTAIAGETVSVEFTGPKPASGDWITVVAPDAEPSKYGDYAYTRQGSPAQIRMPLDAGDYEIRFVQANKKVLARQPIVVTEATATLSAPERVVGGTFAKIEFTGPPAGNGDYIAISKMGSDDLKYEAYAPAKAGSPANLRIPKEPGEYELRFIHGNKKVLARRPITVTAAE